MVIEQHIGVAIEVNVDFGIVATDQGKYKQIYYLLEP